MTDLHVQPPPRPGWFSRALTGLAAGALLAALLLGAFALGSLLGLPSVSFSVFEWLVRVLPGRLVIFGLETTLRVLETLGLNIKNTAKTAEEALAITGLFVAATVVGALFFGFARSADRDRLWRAAAVVAGALGVFSLVLVYVQAPLVTASGAVIDAIWVLGVFQVWGWGLARLCAAVMPAPPAAAPVAQAGVAVAGPPAVAVPSVPGAPADAAAPAELERLSRRRFVIRMGGLAAAVVVLGAELAEVLHVESGPSVAGPAKAPIPFPNAGSRVLPVPGTRSEYTPLPAFYRVDIDLTPPQVDAATWRLRVGGMVKRPLALTLDQLRTGYPALQQFVTQSCISNPVGGPLISTTLMTGPSFRDVLATAGPQPGARFAHLLSADGFDEVVDLTLIESDPRVALVYEWSGRPLLAEHGFPLRVYVPDVYGMKQPKWITDIVLVSVAVPGYWVKRGWDATAQVKTTSVIDTVATSDILMKGGHTFVPVGGIAEAGSRGISKVEVQVDNGPWVAAQLRPPLSGLTWVLWRYDWPFSQGQHVFSVRAYDGQGRLQITESNPSFPSGATGIDSMNADVLPPGV